MRDMLEGRADRMMRKTVLLSVVAVGAFLTGEACTGVYVGRKVSADGATYLAKSVDDWGMKFWHFSEVVPARTDVAEPARGYFGFEWPLPKTTYRYVTQPRATQFRTGRLACGVMNEKGLAVSGAVTAWPKRELLALDPFVKTGAAEENMPDWIGPSCATAQEALDLFAKVIASRGSIEGDIYMIADRHEAWYLEIYTGHHWAAVRMPEDMVMTQGNEFMIDDVNPSSPDFRCSPGLFDLIGKAGCAVRGASGRIHLAASCGAPLNDFHNMRTWWGRKAFAPSVAKDYEPRRRYETFFRPDGKVSMADVFRFLRSHYEGTPQCVDTNGRSDIKVIGSENQELEHLQAIRADVPDEFAVTTWTALGPTEHSVFVPVPALLDRFEADWACDSPAGAPESHVETRAVAHKLRKLATLARIDRERYGLPIRVFWECLEKRYLAEWPKRFDAAMRLGDHARAAAALSEYSRACQREVSRETQELIDQLMNYMIVDVRTCRWHPAPDGYGIVPVPQNPPFKPKASVPEPRPVRSSVEITALYYPGTEHRPEWDMIDQTCPERKPLLGWYDEGNPEAIDWQIKWAVEHGISSFCVDWYWNRGSRRLEHWVKGFQKAKFRKYLKWYMMYANHNQPGAHSTEDQIAVTKYWIDNYFRTPEYYRIDGKPVVCIWQAWRIDSDFIAEAAEKGEKLAKGEGLRRAFAISERLVREAGLPGIHWQDMWRTRAYDAKYAAERRAQGYGTAIGYNFDTFAHALAPGAMKPGETTTRYSFDVVTNAIGGYWREMSTQGTLPFWPILPTGWDDRPRSFSRSRVITDRTVEKFAAVCRAARKFCDETHQRHLLILPINEWQEGSYIEPNAEYGFGMYDAIRDAFCERPAEGWPKNLVPADVGLGPYDFPETPRRSVRSWDFDDGTTQGWYRQPYGGGEVENHDGCLTFVVNRLGNFNIRQRIAPFASEECGMFRIRMRVKPNPRTGLGRTKTPMMRLKWGTPETPIIGKGLVVDPKRCVASCPVVCDGEWHEYALDLAAHADWRGRVDELWFEAADVMDARVAIDRMCFAEIKGREGLE